MCVCVCVFAAPRSMWGLCSLCVCAQSCLTLCDPMDCSPPGSSVHKISYARMVKWVAISSSRASSCLRDWTPSLLHLLYWQAGLVHKFSSDCKFWGGRGCICLCPPLQASTLQGVDCSITVCWIDCGCLKYFNQQNVLNNLNYSKSTHLHMNKGMLIKKLLSYS